ncbi:MAG: efflux RND transporter permease subunit [Acidobacteria bacterium]|nr:efflux RND transporter permease subunit [Acidobacteriota bacterium]
MNLARFTDRHHKATYLVVALLCVAGLYAATQLPSSIYPEVEFPRIIIVAEGSQLEPRNMVTAVARPLENAVSELQGVQIARVTTRAVRGSAEISVQFAPSTDMQLALQLVQAKIAEVQPELPTGLDVSAERLTPSVFPIISYNVTGAAPATLRDLATYTIRPRLARLPGVAQVRVEGGDVREIEIVVAPERLAANHLTINQIEDAVAQTSAVSSVGRVSRDYQQYNVLATGEALSLEDIKRIVVSTPSSGDNKKTEDNGADRAPVRVGDVAEVRYGAEDRTSIFTGDGVPAALVSVTRQIGGNTVEIADEVDGVIKELQPQLPKGVKVERVYNQAALVSASIANVRDAIIIGGLLAVVVLLAFLGHVRITIIAATTIPLTVVITFFFMRLFGQTFNLMSLGGIAVAIGLVIDDAVVVVENIERHLRRRTVENRRDAIYGSVGELTAAVIGSTLTTVVVFLPLVLLEGVTGQFFSALSVALTVAVLVSLVLALTLIPLLADRFLPRTAADDAPPLPPTRDDSRVEPEDEEGAMTYDESRLTRGGRIAARIQRLLASVERRYVAALDFVFAHRRAAILATLAAVALGALVYTRLETGFLPEMDEGGFVLDYRLPPGTSLAETNRVVSEIEGVLKETPEVAAFSRRTGSQLGFFATDPNAGDILVRLKDNRRRDSDEIISDIREDVERRYPQANAEFVKLLEDVINDLAGEPRPVEIKLFGNDLPTLQKTAAELGERVEKIQGVVEMYNGVAAGAPELVARVDPVRAARAGLTVQAISQQLNDALIGHRVAQVKEGDRLTGVRVRLPDDTRFDFAKISNVPVTTPSGVTQPLSAFADIEREAGQSELVRQDQRQMVEITAGLEKRDLGSAIKDVRAIISKTDLPPGVTYELGGQYASQQTAFTGLLMVFGLALALVFVVLVVQFRSYTEPLVILFAAPVSLVGALIALLVTRTPLNISSFMGLIMLVGLVVKNGIILLDYRDKLLEERSLSMRAALREAGRVRLRPILMTTLCTIFGLLPLAVGLGAGAELQRPLAVAVIGGLTLSTFVTLLVVPTLSLQIEEAGARRRLRRRSRLEVKEART